MNFDSAFLLAKLRPPKDIHSSLSVQSMSDRANKYGREINNTWVGSPLRIHRRCIDPMFTIANDIAYEGIMYNATNPTNIETKLQTKFILVEGKVSLGKHYVSNQGDVVEKIIIDEIHHSKKIPDLFIISPFSEVPKELKKRLLTPIKVAVSSYKDIDSKKVEEWLNESIGTVHTFQGKQADCVILCLGLDENSAGAASWASSKPNLLNVALTRAKYRFIAIGNEKIWLEKKYFKELKKLNN